MLPELFFLFFLFHLLLLSSFFSFSFFLLSSSSCTINRPNERILFVSAHRRLIIEAKFPQITMKHGAINVGCVRGNRVVYVSYTLGHGLATSRRSFADAPIGRILNFTRLVSRLDLAAAIKFE